MMGHHQTAYAVPAKTQRIPATNVPSSGCFYGFAFKMDCRFKSQTRCRRKQENPFDFRESNVHRQRAVFRCPEVNHHHNEHKAGPREVIVKCLCGGWQTTNRWS